MKLKLQKGGDIVLTKQDFVASGGEGSVYARTGRCYKIYTKPGNMIPNGKIQELSAIKNPNIIKPEDVLLNGTTPVGYSMRYVTDTHVLCQLFTKAFKQRNNLDSKKILELIKNMQQGVADVHNGGALIVDLNEMNLLVDKNFKEVFFIDVDSYQTAHYPATAIMDSVRDWHVTNNKWTQETDWYSWAIIAFQMMTGIHPFKGKHPSINGMVDRMKANVSVLNPQVTVPKMVRLDAIPTVYKDWFKAVFDAGQRLKPPTGPVEAVAIRVTPIGKAQALEITKIDISFEMITEKIPSILISTHGLDNVMAYQDRCYVHVGDKVIEYKNETNSISEPVPIGVVANVMPKAAKLYKGIVIQEVLGDWFGYVFPESGKSYQVKLSDLEGYKIVDAKYDSRVLMVVGHKNGKYDKFVYRFERFGALAEVEPKLFWKAEDITFSGLNFTVLDTGVCAHINEKEDLLLFAASPSSPDVKKIRDLVLSSDMKLSSNGNQLIFYKDGEHYSMKMKK